MTDKTILEAAARALRDGNEVHAWGDFFESETREISLVVLAAVTPLIRAAALEEAAQIVEQWSGKRDILHLIRALKEQP